MAESVLENTDLRGELKEKLLPHLKKIDLRDYRLGKFLDATYSRDFSHVEVSICTDNQASYELIYRYMIGKGVSAEELKHLGLPRTLAKLESIIDPNKLTLGSIFRKKKTGNRLINHRCDESKLYLDESSKTKSDLISLLYIDRDEIKPSKEQIEAIRKEFYGDDEDDEGYSDDDGTEDSDHDTIEEEPTYQGGIRKLANNLTELLSYDSVNAGQITKNLGVMLKIGSESGMPDDLYAELKDAHRYLKRHVPSEKKISRADSSWDMLKKASENLNGYAENLRD